MHLWFFDIDGTLITSGGAGRNAAAAALASAFGVPAECGEVPFSGRTDRAITADLFALHGIANTDENWERFQKAYLQHLTRFLRTRTGRVLPGVLPLLEFLTRRPDTCLGLLTGNVQAGAMTKLRHYQLAEHFVFGGYGDLHVDRDDVARAALKAACGVTGRAVEELRMWVVGDTPWDVRCGRAIGARVIAVATGSYPRHELAASEPDLLLDDLSATQDIITLLDSSA